jgi:hypothetical protein
MARCHGLEPSTSLTDGPIMPHARAVTVAGPQGVGGMVRSCRWFAPLRSRPWFDGS